jgi:hypothetical protein
VGTDAGWGDYLATSTPSADAGGADAAGAAAEPAVAEPVADVVGLPESAASTVENEVAGAAADQDWANWHASTGTDWQDPAHAEIAEDHYETATDYDALIADRVETAAADGIVYE